MKIVSLINMIKEYNGKALQFFTFQAVVGLGGDKKVCEELETKIFSAYELSFVQDEIKLKNELSEVLDKVIGIVEKVTSNEFQGKFLFCVYFTLI